MIIETFPGATINTIRPLLDGDLNQKPTEVKSDEEQLIDKE